MKILAGGEGKKRRCVCGRMITPGKKHRDSRSLKGGWCSGKRAPGEVEAIRVWLPVHRALSSLAIDGKWRELQLASEAAAKQLGLKLPEVGAS